MSDRKIPDEVLDGLVESGLLTQAQADKYYGKTYAEAQSIAEAELQKAIEGWDRL